MKKRLITSFLLLGFLIFSAIVSAQTTDTATTANPIKTFMEKEISSETLRIIGAPTTLPFQTLLIYLLFIIIVYVIILDLLNSVNLFEKKRYNYAIGLIVVILGVYTGITYNLIITLTEIQFTSLALTGVGFYITLGVLAAYLLIRTLVKIIKRNNRTDEEKVEERVRKLKHLRRMQDIEAMANE